MTAENKPVRAIDVLIVGSGPAGTSTALHLLQQDPSWAERMIVVDKAIHPREKLCGGGITFLGDNVLADLGLTVDVTHFEVHEVRLVYEELSYSFLGDPVLRIVHRAEFDHWLVRTAEERGAEIHQGETILEVNPQPDYVEVISDRCIYHAQTLVAADGSRSRIRSKLKWNTQSSHVARLIEVLTPETRQTSKEIRDGVAVFDFTPMDEHDLQGYYWDFPSQVEGQIKMNRGVFDSRALPNRPKADLKQTLHDSLAERQRDMDDYQIKGHPIRWFTFTGPVSQDRIILAGDSAGVDPLFGEGISLALAYGDVAAKAIEHAFQANDFSYGSYRRRILTHGILWQLIWRVPFARISYWIKSRWLTRLGWRIAPWVVRLTPWRNPGFQPAKKPVQTAPKAVETSPS